jgi:hypothetical protein
MGTIAVLALFIRRRRIIKTVYEAKELMITGSL